jgi:hypothetical protein
MGEDPVSTPETSTATDPDPIVLSGAGEGASAPFVLQSGPALFHVEHATATFFAAFLLNANGDHLAVLANATAPISGTQFIGNDAGGTYHLHVVADDDWRIVVSQPGQDRSGAATSDTVFGGEDLSISPPLALLPGKLELSWRHRGSYPLALTLWTMDGRSIGKAVFNGRVPVGIASFDVPQAGTYLLNIQADGPWNLVLARRP